MTAEDKNNIDRKTDPSKCEAIYFGESKRSLNSRSDGIKRSVHNRSLNWDLKLLIGKSG